MLIAFCMFLFLFALWPAYSRRDREFADVLYDRADMSWPAPRWYRLAERWFPNRCREVPEATKPDVVLIRQFAIIKEHVYLQQFASSENREWMHSHPWAWGTIAIGLAGSVRDKHLGNDLKTRRKYAPYFNYYGPTTVHQSTGPSPGHTSIFIGLGRKTDEKNYFVAVRKHWREHIQKIVRRI